VIDPATGKVVAGMRTEDGKALADVRALIRSGDDRPFACGSARWRQHHDRRRGHEREAVEGGHEPASR
jgi:hypothetical protein